MKNWFYSNNGQQAGPVTEEVLRGLLANGLIDGSTLVWTEGMSGWQPASVALGQGSGDTEAASPPPPPPPPSGDSPGAFKMSPVQPTQGGGPVPTHLCPAILATLFCCIPFGIPAIVFAAQANSANASGDYAHAAECAKKAAMWGWIAFGVGILQVVVGGVMSVIPALIGR